MADETTRMQKYTAKELEEKIDELEARIKALEEKTEEKS